MLPCNHCLALHAKFPLTLTTARGSGEQEQRLTQEPLGDLNTGLQGRKPRPPGLRADTVCSALSVGLPKRVCDRKRATLRRPMMKEWIALIALIDISAAVCEQGKQITSHYVRKQDGGG